MAFLRGSLIVWLAALGSACSERRAFVERPVPRSEPPRPLAAGPAPSAAVPNAGPSRAAPSAEVAPAPASAAAPLGELARFHAALAELAAGKRRDSVRALWFGDSHTAAEFWTGTVRSVLQRRFGAGGPGYLRVGVPQVRHDQARLESFGKFRVDPLPPARRAPQGDGVFGLGGIRVTATDAARAVVELNPGSLRGRARFELLFGLAPKARFVAALGDRSRPIAMATGAPLGSPIARLALEGEAGEAFELRGAAGGPRFYGLVVEGSEPGFVLDALGIDGARIATTLAWNEAAFVAEVAARRPDLVVTAYGTNEAFDELAVGAYAGELGALVGRLRRGAPGADCLVLGPPAALDRRGVPVPRVAAIGAVYARTARELGCAFLSAEELMGGAAGFAGWQRSSPALAAADGIHLTPAGYRRLGELTAARMLPPPEAGSP